MRVRPTSLLLSTGIILAVMAGIYITQLKPLYAVDDIIIDWHPGTQSSGFHEYNCGWHDGACSSPYDTSGSYIDFRNSSTHSVFWRSDAYDSGSVVLAPVAAGIHSVATTGCNLIQVLLYDGFAVLRGIGNYVHTDNDNGSSFTVYGRDTRYEQETLIGKSSNYGTNGTDGSDPDCAHWNGPHIHQGGSSFAHQFTSNYPPASTAHTDGMPRSGTVWIDDNRLFQASWTE